MTIKIIKKELESAKCPVPRVLKSGDKFKVIRYSRTPRGSRREGNL